MKKYFLLFLLLSGVSVRLFSQDRFAEIATRMYEERSSLLMEPQPPVLPEKYLPVTNDKSAGFKPMNKLDTPEELAVALKAMKGKYAPYLRELAPPLSKKRDRFLLKDFDWRIGTFDEPRELSDAFDGKGEWQKVTIPHYGPPLGRAVTYYRKEFGSDQLPSFSESLYLCFKAVDYKAAVYLNGILIGTHEGFFAPFEFDVTRYVKKDKNVLLVRVENDFTTTGGTDDKGNRVIGDKIYAGTGLGYDDPIIGWHHCPPAMGIYQDCYFEARSSIHVNDLFVRPLTDQKKVEAWIEINNREKYPEKITLSFSVYGLNFEQTVVRDFNYIPQSIHIPGVGDLAKPTDNKIISLPMGFGVNYLKVQIPMENFKTWELDEPWLYQMQVKVLDERGKVLDEFGRDFGMRSFTMDTVSKPKGMMYLNGRSIRLRGANTMGHLQQCVLRGNYDQLIEDILLAKICNMNYLRLTQRPVQPEIYTYCDKLGLMNQTDLPLFGGLRRSQFAQAVKQAEEMERLVRSHPSTTMVTYINERFPNAEGNPQRSFSERSEYEKVFKALDQAILLNNPDRVIKAGDGDYDPPSPGLPDNHCYNGWYNGHGLGLGQMHKGYWMFVKPDWYYACGEFGSEGLDPKSVMYKYYPKSWLPTNVAEEKNWLPNRISQAQTNNFHYMWYPTQHSLQGWIDASQTHQEWVTKFTTEAFRRDNRMVSFAIHLFIDAWPAGWMKTIMDVDRQPKKAYFAYRDALSPMMVSLRSDRDRFYSEEKIKLEAWISNDTQENPANYSVKYQLEQNGKILFANSVKADIKTNLSQFQGYIDFVAPKVSERKKMNLRIQLCNEKGESIHENNLPMEIFPRISNVSKKVCILEGDHPLKSDLLLLGTTFTTDIEQADVIITSDYTLYRSRADKLNAEVEKGKVFLFTELPTGNYDLSGRQLKIERTVMGDYFFVNPITGHPMMKKYEPFDFKCWYDAKLGYITPLLYHTIVAPELTCIVGTGSTTWTHDQGAMSAVSELKYGKGVFRICEVTLSDRLSNNPTTAMFLRDLIVK